MTMLLIVWKNIWHKPLQATLSLLLFALGVGLVSFLLLLNRQMQENFEKNLANIDLVLGAKGSPLQLILCSMYHIDSPTGNIKFKEIQPFLNPNHPLIEKAIPLSLGDSYQGYRIAGTNASFSDLYQAKTAEGRLFNAPLEATIGAAAASATGLKLNAEFSSSHGLINDGLDNTHEQKFKVVGIFEPTGSVIDQLILTPLESIWQVHEAHHHEEEEEHEEEELSITSLLVRYRSKTNFQVLNLPRNINENTNMQAAVPAIEMNRLYSMLGLGEQALRSLALVIILVSGLSIFISLFNSLKERRYELALMRVMGASRFRLFAQILLEALLLSFIGCVLGILFSHCSMQLFATYMQSSFRYTFTGWRFLTEEYFLIIAALSIGVVAGILPAIMAFRTDISKTLGKD
jgi:putative ABC transport system permease protein